MSVACLFPGQGSQAVGMGKALADTFSEARAVFAEVDDALSQPLSHLMFEGPLDALTLTSNAQPALMAVSLAVVRVLEAHRGFDLARSAAFVAGHSLGEYSALTAVGAIGLSDAAHLLRLRGEAMQQAVPVGEGGMAAILGLEFEAAVQLAQEAAEGDVCQAANDNGGGQVVLSGHARAIARAIALAPARGAKRAIPLTVSAPFHCALMQPAAEAMREALRQSVIHTPRVPVVSNVHAHALTDPETIRDALVTQVTATVRWRESVLFMVEKGVDCFYELGSGKVLSGLVKRIAPGTKAVSIGTSDDIAMF